MEITWIDELDLALRERRINVLEACIGGDELSKSPTDGSPDPCFALRKLDKNQRDASSLSAASLKLADTVDIALNTVVR